ncbi:MAG: hypothetical protein Q9M26_06585 [Mariprofundales bacterium]|nr:hypothetical protein [Mariprofundales bacterium]
MTNPITLPTAANTLIGLAPLTAYAFTGADLGSIGQQLMDRIQQDPENAAIKMDLATLFFLAHEHDAALELQAAAIAQQQRYHLASSPPSPSLRILALVGAGDLMDNTPLEFLLEGSTIAMDLHFMQLGAPLPQDLASYDLALVAVGESDRNQPLLRQLDEQLRDCPIPLLNKPSQIMQTTREDAAAALRQTPGVDMPESVRVDRTQLQQLATGALQVTEFLHPHDFPIIIRPVHSHAGHGLARLDQATEIPPYLAEQDATQFYISRFVDYSSEDGQFRKYRIALIDGEPLICHLAISSHWIVHYLNADMVGNADKCAEEAASMKSFSSGFGVRQQQACAHIRHRLNLDYLILDCAELADGTLLIFEVDTSAIVHAMDPVDTFPYKRPQMEKTFAAFQSMLMRYGKVTA